MKKVQLRKYQNECVDGARAAIAEGNRKIACVLPTGSGKTTIFGSICKGFTTRSNQKAVIVSHLGLLTSQTGDRFRGEWDLESSVLQADRLPSADSQTVITTMQSFRSEKKLLDWSRKLSFGTPSIERLNVGLLIIDECHLVGNDSYNNIIDMFPNAIVIGFTATPFRQNKLMTNIFEKVAYTISTQELIDLGFLVPPKLLEMSFDTTDQADMFAKIIHTYKTFHNGQKSVVYLKTIEEAELLRNVLVEAGITSSAVTSKLTGKPRDELLKAFRKGDGPNILTTVDVLTAGFDSPNLRSIFMPYKVGSVTTYLQRVGRGLRPDAGKDHCAVYVNSNSPKIEPGFWEKINKEMLEVGKRDTDTYQEDLDLLKGIISEEQYRWTKEVIDMAKTVEKRGMEGLASMILNKEFPPEMLDIFIEQPPTSRAGKAPATDKQIWYLDKRGIDAKGLTKKECSAIINAEKLASGWKPESWQIVPDGQFKGKQMSNVPHAYWQHLKRNNPHSTTYQAYRKYAEKLKEIQDAKK